MYYFQIWFSCRLKKSNKHSTLNLSFDALSKWHDPHKSVSKLEVIKNVKTKFVLLIHYSKKIKFQKNQFNFWHRSWKSNFGHFSHLYIPPFQKIQNFLLIWQLLGKSNPNFVHQKLIPYNRSHANIHSTLHSSLLFINVARKFSGFRLLWQSKPQFHAWAYRLDWKKKNTTNHTTYTYILKQ